MRIAATPTTSDEGLLGANAQRLELALISARTAATLRRMLDNVQPDGVDVAILRKAADVMSDTAEALETLAAGGTPKRKESHFGFGTMAYAVELTAPQTDADELPGYLRQVATSLAHLESEADPKIAADLLSMFSLLADIATQQAGTMGENTVTVA